MWRKVRNGVFPRTEIDEEVDMVNGGGNVHGGCSAYLIDLSVSKLSDERCLTISQMLYTTDSCAARCD